MPIIAIGAAIAATYVAAAGIAAAGALTAITALEVVAAVGATVGAIGAVTKNKALMTAGTIVGAIGAIGGLAAGAGLLGEAAASNAPLFGEAVAGEGADAAAAGSIDAMSGAEGGAWDAAPPVESVGDVSPTTGAIASDVPAPAATEAAAPAAAADPADQYSFIKTDTPVTAAASAAPPTGATDTTAGILSTPPSEPTDLLGSTGMSAATAKAASTPLPAGEYGPVATGAVAGEGKSGLLGATSGLLAFADAHPMVAFGALQAGGSLLSGATSSLTPAQVAALQAQSAANDAAAALTKQQTTNRAMPKAVAASAPVTGAPAPLVPQVPLAPGFINNAPRVSGVAA